MMILTQYQARQNFLAGQKIRLTNWKKDLWITRDGIHELLKLDDAEFALYILWVQHSPTMKWELLDEGSKCQ